jgi:hypothetical protein
MSQAQAHVTDPTLDLYALEVDRLGDLRARAKELRDDMNRIEAKLKATGRSEFFGIRYRVTVSLADRATVAWKAIAEKLMPSHQLVAAHTSHKEVCTVRVSAHKKVA